MSEDIRHITEVIELGFADYLAYLAVKDGGYELVRDTHPVRAGASVTVRNRLGVDFIIEVEASWAPAAEVV